MSQKKSYWT